MLLEVGGSIYLATEFPFSNTVLGIWLERHIYEIEAQEGPVQKPRPTAK